MCIAGPISAWRARRTLSEQNMRLDAAINNMIQGLCMFDAQNRLVVWNERYRTCTTSIRSASGAAAASAICSRRASRPERFRSIPAATSAELRAAVEQGKTFTVNIELNDGRTIAVVNQPIKGGGWVATHEDITERKRAERDWNRPARSST